ncbi:MAG: hypothetical protein QXU18_06405 [Thermoplasmatales archaeon]
MNNEVRKHKAYTLNFTPEEYKRVKEKAVKFGIPLSRLLVLGAINWDGKLQNE